MAIKKLRRMLLLLGGDEEVIPPSDAWITTGAGGCLYRGTNFTVDTSGESVVNVSFWLKFGSIPINDDFIFEFWYSTSTTLWAIHWDHAQQRFEANYAKNGGGNVAAYFPKASLPSEIVDPGTGRPKADLWVHYNWSLSGAGSSHLHINNVSQGILTADGYPLQSNFTNAKGRFGDARNIAVGPMVNGSGLAQVRVSVDWTPRANFLNANPTRWNRPINWATESGDLVLAWPFSSDGLDLSPANADFTLTTGAFTVGGGPPLLDPV